MTPKIPHRNLSPHGWWIATYIERAAWDDDLDPNVNSRCIAWENTILIQAADRDIAYEKAIALGSDSESTFSDGKGRTGRWVFEGLVSLLPIYDELRDGAELAWEEHRNRTLKKVRSWVRPKHELEAFDDTSPYWDKEN